MAKKKEIPDGWEKIQGTRRLTDDEFRALATQRAEARIDKNFKEADRLLAEINTGGFWIEDDGAGYSFGLLPGDMAAGAVEIESRVVGVDRASEKDSTVSVLQPWNPGKKKS
jgi:hypothetical protein